MQLRPASVEDLPDIVKLEETFEPGDRFSEQSYRYLIRSNSFVWVLEDTEFIGTAVVLVRKNSKTARLYTVAISEKFRGQGLGKRFITDIVEKLTSLGYNKLSLEVKESNINAWKLYESLGFKLQNLIENYYADGSTAKRYVKDLK